LLCFVIFFFGSEFPFLSSTGVGGGEEALAKSLDAFCSLREEV
jgi:hypothetical protein